MKKETVVRQNPCDREMLFFFLGSFVLYMALQLFGGNSLRTGLANALNLGLYMIFVPGFVFLTGYRFQSAAAAFSAEEGKKIILREAALSYICFLVLALGQMVCYAKTAAAKGLYEILVFMTMPSVSAVFFSLAVLLLFVWIFYEKLLDLLEKKLPFIVLIGVFCLLLAMLRTSGQAYEFAAALFGAEESHGVPIVPYFGYFLLGAYIAKKKPAFQWKLFVGALAVTVLSAALYRTLLQDISRVAISLLPVYAVYCFAELLAEGTLRAALLKKIVALVVPVSVGYTAIVFFFCRQNLFLKSGVKRSVLLAGVLFAGLYVAIGFFHLMAKGYAKGSLWFNTKVKHKTAVYFGLYTVLFTFFMACAFLDLIYKHKTFIWVGDGLTQYYPRALFFSRYIRELLSNLIHGNFVLPMYDFRNGFGGEISSTLEPLYFLYPIFGRNHIELAYNVVAILRFYFAGMASSALFIYFKKRYDAAFLGSIVYTFCGFALYSGTKHTSFIGPMILLPLMVIAIEEIIRGRRWYLTTILVAVSLLSSYYYLFMNTIAVGTYFVVRFCCQADREKRTVGNFFKKGFIISGSYILGVAMSCIALVTKFGMYVNSGRAGDVRIATPSLFFYSKGWLSRCILYFLTTANSPGRWMKLGYLPIALLAVVFLFMRKGRKELKILTVISLSLLLFPVSGFVFSGFSSIVNRWCYMVSLIVGYILADCLPEMRNLKKKEIGVLAATVLVYGYLAFNAGNLSTMYTKIAAVLLAATFAIVLVMQEKNQWLHHGAKQMLMLVFTAVLLIYQGHSEFTMAGELAKNRKIGESESAILDTPLAAMSQIEDDSFYRAASVQHSYWTSSASLLLDYYGITTVNSTLNSSLMQYLAKMGATSYSVTQLMGLSNRTMLSALASVKYSGYFDDSTATLMYGYEDKLHTEVNGKATTIAENQYSLPIGYTYEKTISEEELENYDVEERQEVLLQEAVIHGAESTGKSDAAVTGRKIEIQSKEESGVLLSEHALTAEKESGKITFQFEGLPNSETYIVMKNANLPGDGSEVANVVTTSSKCRTSEYNFHPDDGRYGTGQEDYVFNLGYSEEPLTTCSIKMSRIGTIDFDSFEIYCQPMEKLEEYINHLKENVLENVKIDTNLVSGEVSLDKPKTLVLSIPFQKGWTAKVDGEPVKLQRVNYMYMGLELEKGVHSVELHYAIPGMKYVLVIMPVSVVLFIILCMATWIYNKRKKKSV